MTERVQMYSDDDLTAMLKGLSDVLPGSPFIFKMDAKGRGSFPYAEAIVELFEADIESFQRDTVVFFSYCSR